MSRNDADPTTEAAIHIAELALQLRSELEDHKKHLENGRWHSHAAHDMGVLLDAITTYERRKALGS